MLFHLPISSLRRPVGAVAFVVFVAGGVALVFFGRAAMPPVPLYVKAGGVGPALREDGELTLEATVLREGSFKDLYAVTDVSVVGKGEAFRHVWRKGTKVLTHEAAKARATDETHVMRVATRVAPEVLADAGAGHYTVDVETSGGQIVGRLGFDIEP